MRSLEWLWFSSETSFLRWVYLSHSFLLQTFWIWNTRSHTEVRQRSTRSQRGGRRAGHHWTAEHQHVSVVIVSMLACWRAYVQPHRAASMAIDSMSTYKESLVLGFCPICVPFWPLYSPWLWATDQNYRSNRFLHGCLFKFTNSNSNKWQTKVLSLEQLDTNWLKMYSNVVSHFYKIQKNIISWERVFWSCWNASSIHKISLKKWQISKL